MLRHRWQVNSTLCVWISGYISLIENEVTNIPFGPTSVAAFGTERFLAKSLPFQLAITKICLLLKLPRN